MQKWRHSRHLCTAITTMDSTSNIRAYRIRTRSYDPGAVSDSRWEIMPADGHSQGLFKQPARGYELTNTRDADASLHTGHPLNYWDGKSFGWEGRTESTSCRKHAAQLTAGTAPAASVFKVHTLYRCNGQTRSLCLSRNAPLSIPSGRCSETHHFIKLQTHNICRATTSFRVKGTIRGYGSINLLRHGDARPVRLAERPHCV